MSHDTTPRYAPDRVIIARAMKLCPVKQYIVHATPPAKCPISAPAILELVTDYGSRWFGCDRAWINSELRMVTIGFNSRDEVRSKWEVCTTE
jgi:hypothetical protein